MLVAWTFAGLAQAYTWDDFNYADHNYQQALNRVAELEGQANWQTLNAELRQAFDNYDQGVNICNRERNSVSAQAYMDCIEGYQNDYYEESNAAYARHTQAQSDLADAQIAAADALAALNVITADLRAQGLL